MPEQEWSAAIECSSNRLSHSMNQSWSGCSNSQKQYTRCMSIVSCPNYVIGCTNTCLFLRCFVIMYIYILWLYFLCTNSSAQSISTVCCSELMHISAFLFACHVKQVRILWDWVSYLIQGRALCAALQLDAVLYGMLHSMAGLFLLSTLKRLLTWQHEDQFLLLFILFVIICIYFCVIYCISCHQFTCARYINCMLQQTYIDNFSAFLFSCHVKQVKFLVRLGKLLYPRPCFMRRSAVGCCSVWNVSQYGRSIAIMNVEETANMATWGSVSLALHSLVIMCIYFLSFIVFLVHQFKCARYINCMRQQTYVDNFSALLFSCHVKQVGFLVRLGKLPYPRPCFMRRSAVGCCSVWNASQYGRSTAIMNIEETANMATWGSVSLALHSLVIMCIYFCVIYCISCSPIQVCKIYQLYAAANLCW